MYTKTELVSLSEIHKALVDTRFNRTLAAINLGISRSHISVIIRTKMIGVPTQQEYKARFGLVL